jgi:hypothetical protein
VARSRSRQPQQHRAVYDAAAALGFLVLVVPLRLPPHQREFGLVRRVPPVAVHKRALVRHQVAVGGCQGCGRGRALPHERESRPPPRRE